MSKSGLVHDARTKKTTDVWLTPPNIIKALGEFDLDPCFLPDGERIWDTAKVHFHEGINGLIQDWSPYPVVWMNPPYNPKYLKAWMTKLADHGNGIALTFARTETAAFRVAWQRANAMLFLSKRIQFLNRYGEPKTLDGKDSNSGAPSVLIAFGEECAARLVRCGLEGALVTKIAWKEKPKSELVLF
jgi:hypothetical protein